MRCSITLIWRVLHGERALLEVHSDPLVHRLAADGQGGAPRHAQDARLSALPANRSDADGAERFVAWFEPDHFILERAAPFFVDRFRGLAWSILTPIGSLHWDRESAACRPAARQRSDAPDGDALRGRLARLLRKHLQPGARQSRPRCAARCRRNTGTTCRRPQAIPRAGPRSPGRALREMIEREAARPRKRDPDEGRRRHGASRTPQALAELNRMIAASGPLVPGADPGRAGRGPAAAPRSPSSASSRATRRTSRAGPSSARPVSSSTGAGGGRHRPRRGLCHQRGEAFQIRAARQAPHPPEADRRRGEALSLVADEASSISWRRGSWWRWAPPRPWR